jgi:diguanylate cyclase (GGDEF)-like protein/PAS domain S-box-containing protein
MAMTSLEDLFARDNRLRVFNDTVPAGILVVAVEDGRMVFSNRFFNTVLGVDASAILGTGWRDLFVDPDERERMMLQFVETGEVRNFELRLRCQDGRQVWGLASLSEIPIEGEALLLFAFVDITALKEAEDKIRHLAYHDALTGLTTLRRFKEVIEEARARADRDGSQFAVLFIDLDRFKAVNDSLGHEAGDAVLTEVARRLHDSVRATDTVARIGGDEFVVLAEHVTIPLVMKVAERIVARTSQPFVLASGVVSIGASVGIALYPHHGNDLEDLIKVADQAMYTVKRTTKGAVAIAPC